MSARMQRAFLMMALAAGLWLLGALPVAAGEQALPNGGTPAPAFFDNWCTCYCRCVGDFEGPCQASGYCCLGARTQGGRRWGEGCFCNFCFVFYGPTGAPREDLACLPAFGPHTDRMVQALLKQGRVRQLARR